MPFLIIKADPAQQIVYGWGNVSIADGDLVTDLQGDQIEPADLERAVTDFMLHSRESGVMHEGEPVGDVVASLVTTPDVMKAFFGDEVKTVPVGWMLGVKVRNKAIFRRVVAGELKAFSIQGTADRVPA